MSEYDDQDDANSEQQLQQLRQELKELRELVELRKREELRERTQKERDEALKERDEVLKERDEVLKRQRDTTLEEFVMASHQRMSVPLQIEPNQAIATKGGLTSPVGRLCPSRLRPWIEFPHVQEKALNTLRMLLQPQDGQGEIHNESQGEIQNQSQDAKRLFPSLAVLEALGRQACAKRLASEADLRYYDNFAISCQVRLAMREIADSTRATEHFGRSCAVRFDAHSTALPDDDVSGLQRRGIADRCCFHDESDELLYLVEYKAAHKLSPSYLRSGLRSIDVWQHVVQRADIPTDADAKLLYNAELLTATALTQIFDYMINEGIEYSYLTNGPAFVFLYIPHDDAETLYYHLAEPTLDVESAPDGHTPLFKTALALVLGLTVMSLSSRRRTQSWRNNACSKLKLWNVDFQSVLAQMPEKEVHSSPPGSEYMPATSPNVSLSASPSSSPPIAPRSPNSPSSHHPSSSYANHVDDVRLGSQYCTQTCLLGLRNRGNLDEHCPNIDLHRSHKSTDFHLIDNATLVQLLKHQLDQDVDHFCTPFGHPGGYGVAFKVTCVEYGYTFVAKGTTDDLWTTVSQEADIYKILDKAQGSAIPVFLGAIDLDIIIFMTGIHIKHMLLMSWAGQQISEDQILDRAMLNQVKRSKHEIRKLGVRHDDFRWPNVLWNPIEQRVQIIDFHKSTLLPKHHHAPTDKVSSKRNSSSQDTLTQRNPKRR